MSAKHAVWVAALLVPFYLGSGWAVSALASDEDTPPSLEALLPEPDGGLLASQEAGTHALTDPVGSDASVPASKKKKSKVSASSRKGSKAKEIVAAPTPAQAAMVSEHNQLEEKGEPSAPPAQPVVHESTDAPSAVDVTPEMAAAGAEVPQASSEEAPAPSTSSKPPPVAEVERPQQEPSPAEASSGEANEGRDSESRQQTIASASVAEETVPAAFPEDNPFAPGDAVVANGERETLSVSVISWRDLPFQTVRRQSFDYSCGSAALATLLTYVYDTPTAEKTVFRDMFQKGNKAKIRREGFSMMDMSNYLNRRGFKAGGYRLSFDLLQKKKVPVIALINNEGYKHFVVVKSLGGPFVLVGDPNKGNVVYTRNAFAGMWDGIALVVTNHAGKARTAFQNPKEWLYARQRIFPGEGQYPGMDDINQSFINWQVAPANTDLIEGPMRLFSSGRLP